MPPIYGLYQPFVPAIIYLFLGTSRQNTIGPEAANALMIRQAVDKFVEAHGEPDNVELRIAAALTLSIIQGIFLLVLGLLRLGFVDSIFSRPLIHTFIMAVAVVIMTEQFDSLLGIITPPDVPDIAKDRFVSTITHLGDTNVYTLAVSMTALAFLLMFTVFRRKYPNNAPLRIFPAILVVVVVGTVVSWQCDLPSFHVKILGNVTTTVLQPQAPLMSASDFFSLAGSAVVVSIVGFVETMAVVKTYSARHKYPVSSNRELVALGVANLIGGFFNSYSAFGSLTR